METYRSRNVPTNFADEAKRGEQLYYEMLADRLKAAAEHTKRLEEESRKELEEIRKGFEEERRKRESEMAIPTVQIKLNDDIDKIHAAFEKMREEERKAYEQMTGEVRKGAGEIFDAIVSRGKGAFSELGDWIEGVLLSRLKQLFQNLVVSIMTGFKQGLSGLLQNVIPGVGNGNVGSLIGSASSAGAGLLGTLGLSGLMVPGNAAIKTAAGLGAGLFGGAGMITAGMVPGMGAASFGSALGYLSSGAGLFGTGGLLGMGALTMPVIGGAIVALTYGLPKLISAIQGKTSEQAGAMEVTRDLGIGYGKDQFKAFYETLGLTESSSYGIRHDLTMSPKFLVEQALPIAEATGKIDELLDKLGKAGFRDAFELGRATGDWSELNEQFREAFQNSSSLWKSLPDWESELMAPAANAKTEIQKLSDSLAGMRNVMLSSITPIETMYDKFLATGEITEEFARQIEKVGGSLEKFQELASLNLQISGLQQSLSFIESLASSLKGLAPELDPINQILSGNIGPEAIAALSSAGLDPNKFSGLSSLIGMQRSFGEFNPFQALTPELRDALLNYGGSAGRLAVERYGEGFNTITAELLSSTKAAMDEAYQGAIKDALSYLGEAQKETSDKISELIQAVDEVKMGIVDVLNRILVSLQSSSDSSALSPTAQYARDYEAWKVDAEHIAETRGRWGYQQWLASHPEPKPPSLETGGIVERTGLAVVHEGERFDGGKGFGPQVTMQNCTFYGYDDFVEKVRQAGIDLQRRAFI